MKKEKGKFFLVNWVAGVILPQPSAGPRGEGFPFYISFLLFIYIYMRFSRCKINC
jgi:hypothetical protein